mmetsp:Transcript_65640/g.166351  ORF Transcript_65640/g.166351 Transcript_65640/m.166351 type:complete len:228 (+) Transcript_65640:168-851(+)
MLQGQPPVGLPHVLRARAGGQAERREEAGELGRRRFLGLRTARLPGGRRPRSSRAGFLGRCRGLLVALVLALWRPHPPRQSHHELVPVAHGGNAMFVALLAQLRQLERRPHQKFFQPLNELRPLQVAVRQPEVSVFGPRTSVVPVQHGGPLFDNLDGGLEGLEPGDGDAPLLPVLRAMARQQPLQQDHALVLDGNDATSRHEAAGRDFVGLAVGEELLQRQVLPDEH